MQRDFLQYIKKWGLTGTIFFLFFSYCLAENAAISTDKIKRTPFSMDIYGSIDCAKTGDQLTVFDSDQIPCGTFTIIKPSQYGFLHVYGDDPQTPQDEGARIGDTLSFQINDVPIDVDPIVWSGDARRQRFDIHCKQLFE